MLAALIYSYGSADVLELHTEVKIPEPAEDEVLVRVKAASVNPADWKIRRGDLKFISGIHFPKILGFDLAGEVVGIGSEVSRLRVGDKVFGELDSFSQGSYAQFTVVKEHLLAHMPANLSFEQCAAVPLAGVSALQGLYAANLVGEQRVLVLGGAGGVGTFVVQLAKAFSCEVTASAGPGNQIFLKELGANFTFDYTCQTVRDLDGTYDIIFDTVGKEEFAHCQPLLSKKGRFVTTLPQWANAGSHLLSPFRRQKSKVLLLRQRLKDLQFLKKLLEKDTIHPVIDRVYPLEEIREAHLYSENGHVRGKIVISIT